jgi:hypothetical protein
MMLTAVNSQCIKNASCTASSGRYVRNEVKEADLPVTATINIEGNKITLVKILNGETKTTTYTLKKISQCNWMAYMIVGNATYQVVADPGNGKLEKSIIRVDALDGATRIYFSSDATGKAGLELDLSEIRVAP